MLEIFAMGNSPNAVTCPTSTINGLVSLYDLFNDKFLFLYPFAWSVIIVRKIFFV